jgi:DNA-binding NarL/FixJ family response regulator
LELKDSTEVSSDEWPRVVLADDLSPVLSTVTKLLEGPQCHSCRAWKCPGSLEAAAARTKIVFLTGHEDPDILATCLAAGGLGYVAKVLMEADLIPAMNEALAGREFVSRLPSQQDRLNGK